MKCMCKQARSNKHRFEAERADEREKARFDSLTPEEQDEELTERAVRTMRAKKVLGNACFLGSIASLFNGSYEDF